MDNELADMRRKVDDLGKRIAQREKDLRERGMFSAAHEVYVSAMQKAHIRLAGQVQSAAQASPTRWQGLKDELARDYNALVDELGRLIEHLDESQTKSDRR